MKPRPFPWLRWTIAGGLSLYALLILAVLLRSRSASIPPDINILGDGAGMADQESRWETPADFRAGTAQGLQLSSAGASLTPLGEDGDAYPAQGTWTSQELPANLLFTEAIPSFNATLPPHTGLRFELRVRQGGDWSPWLYFGSWGQTPPPRQRTVEFPTGRVRIDTLVLDKPARALQVRATLFDYSGGAQPRPTLRRVVVCSSGKADGALPPPAGTPASHLPIVLAVPFCAQGTGPQPMKHQICSPSSLTMVMGYWGVDQPLVDNAVAMYDPEYAIFGNWMRAAQRAGELGLDAWVARFRNWDQVRAVIARGEPVIASIQFKAGEFPSAVSRSSEGHLIVIRGFTPTGDIVVNDPASRTRGDGAIYKADELGRAWFGHGGVAYRIRRESPPSN